MTVTLPSARRERHPGRATALIGLVLCFAAGSAALHGAAPHKAKAKPASAVRYKAKCGMTYSAAEAKKYHYICPMDHSRLVPIRPSQTKARRSASNAVRYVQATPEAQEHDLFLTPGGAYTEADIAANGRQTPMEKYHGVMSEHDLHPVAGDFICPITKTKANPKFSWVVGGKTYYFCCPPCIEEFVKQAKEHPESLRPPQDYIKR